MNIFYIIALVALIAAIIFLFIAGPVYVALVIAAVSALIGFLTSGNARF